MKPVSRFVIGSDAALEIGTRGMGLHDGTAYRADQPFLVLEEATEEDWRHCVFDTIGRAPRSGVPAGARFYFVSLD